MSDFEFQPQSTPPAPHPRLTLEVDEDTARVTVDWAKGQDIDMFARALVFLGKGQLSEMTANVIEEKGREIGDGGRAEVLARVVRGQGAGRRRPLVDPRETFHSLLEYAL